MTDELREALEAIDKIIDSLFTLTDDSPDAARLLIDALYIKRVMLGLDR